MLKQQRQREQMIAKGDKRRDDVQSSLQEILLDLTKLEEINGLEKEAVQPFIKRLNRYVLRRLHGDRIHDEEAKKEANEIRSVWQQCYSIIELEAKQGNTCGIQLLLKGEFLLSDQKFIICSECEKSIESRIYQICLNCKKQYHLYKQYKNCGIDWYCTKCYYYKLVKLPLVESEKVKDLSVMSLFEYGVNSDTCSICQEFVSHADIYTHVQCHLSLCNLKLATSEPLLKLGAPPRAKY